jgi:tetratricopeptide (TPR) repeat protein
LGEVLFDLGKFAEGCLLMEESRAIFDDLDHGNLAFATVVLGEAKAYLGQYEQAWALGQRGLTLYRLLSQPWGIGFSHYVLGLTAVAQEAYAEAHHLLEKSVSALREIGNRENTSWAFAVLGYAARGLGQLPQGRQHLCEALQMATGIGAFRPFVLGLSAAALLLADQGEVARAVEMYALASRNPFVANSRWFEDVAGRRIAAVAATLPPKVVAVAQARGRARDLDAAVAELLEELAA